MFKNIINERLYLNPIGYLGLLDYLIFNIKLLLFLLSIPYTIEPLSKYALDTACPIPLEVPVIKTFKFLKVLCCSSTTIH